MREPDIILIVLDTQRADRLGAYGYHRNITPNLDRFASESVLYEQAISPAQWTIPSHASLFTGLYPTAHQVTQSTHALSPDLPHLAEVVQDAGYETIGFCNNPLVGILNNGFKRGFETFYNYGGAIPSLPQSSSGLPRPLNRLAAAYTQFLRRISYPIQNYFGQSDLAFRISLNAWLTPLWSKFANFKGQNERSVKDVVHFLQQRGHEEEERPLFLFLNLMETHMPFWPPGEFIEKTAPYFRQEKEARDKLRQWNREAYRWAAPLPEPLPELESRVLSDLYDAEVAYQDDYLGRLFDQLRRRPNADNTLTIILADHGDGLGEHGYFGHAFVAYQELVHVPLLMHWPAQFSPQRVAAPVSTRRVFHTVVDALGEVPSTAGMNPVDIRRLALKGTIGEPDPDQGAVISEVFPPLNFVKAIRQRQAHLLEQFRCLAQRRAVVQLDEMGDPIKLIEVDEKPDEMFALGSDPGETRDLIAERPTQAAVLSQELQQITSQLQRLQQSVSAAKVTDTAVDEQLRQRLRGLGYID